MEYKELMTKAKDCLGQIDYPMLGKLAKIYTYIHIADSIDKINVNRTNRMKPKEKIVYLNSICRKYASDDSYQKNKNNKIDFPNLNI